MRRRLHISAACWFWFIAAVAAPAQQIVTSIPGGDASLAGRVVDGDSQRPLEGAIVTLTSQDRSRVLKTFSDANGRYLFEGIAASGYLLSAFLDGYGSQAYAPSGTSQGRPGSILLLQGQATNGVNLLLRRAGHITGQITTAGGQPVSGAVVTAIATPEDPGFSISTPAPSARTDSRGDYTITNVPPGSYWVSAEKRDPELVKVRIRPESDLTFFPGAQTLVEAAPIRVGVGETARRIDIALIHREYLRMRGHVVRGQSEGAIEANLVVGRWSVRPIQIADDGAFDITPLGPGRYTFWARARTPDGHEAASITLDLTSEMTDLTLILLPTGALSGRVVTNDGTPLPDGVVVAAVQADEGKQIDPLERDRVDVTERGRFELRGVFGERILRVLGLGPQWEVDRVLRGTIAVQSLLVSAGEQTDDITIVLKRR